MCFDLSFNIIMPPCIQGILLHLWNVFPNCTVFKYAGNKLPGIRLPKFDPASRRQAELSFLSHLFADCFLVCHDVCRSPHMHLWCNCYLLLYNNSQPQYFKITNIYYLSISMGNESGMFWWVSPTRNIPWIFRQVAPSAVSLLIT